MFRRILLAYDGSEGARKALRAAIETAKAFGAELHSITVVEHLPQFAATVGEVQEALRELTRHAEVISQDAARRAAEEGVILHTKVVPGHEVETIVTYVKDGQFDLLVVGFMGHSSVFGRVMGGTTQNLTRLAPCAVLVVK